MIPPGLQITKKCAAFCLTSSIREHFSRNLRGSLHQTEWSITRSLHSRDRVPQ